MKGASQSAHREHWYGPLAVAAQGFAQGDRRSPFWSGPGLPQSTDGRVAAIPAQHFLQIAQLRLPSQFPRAQPLLKSAKFDNEKQLAYVCRAESL